jgi:hypothetical protein
MNTFILENVDRLKIIDILKEEEKVRYSKQIQEIYTTQYYNSLKTPTYKNINIEREIQKHILKYYGYDDSDESLKEYWKIPLYYWNDEEVKNSIFYMKLNIFQYPKIKIGDDLSDVDLMEYKNDKNIKLSDLSSNEKPLIILSGSMT